LRFFRGTFPPHTLTKGELLVTIVPISLQATDAPSSTNLDLLGTPLYWYPVSDTNERDIAGTGWKRRRHDDDDDDCGDVVSVFVPDGRGREIDDATLSGENHSSQMQLE
jgi:hypothetical protein